MKWLRTGRRLSSIALDDVKSESESESVGLYTGTLLFKPRLYRGVIGISPVSIALSSSLSVAESSSSIATGCFSTNALAASLTARRVCEDARNGSGCMGIFFVWLELEELDDRLVWSMAHLTCLTFRAVLVDLKAETGRLDSWFLRCVDANALRSAFRSAFDFCLTRWFAVVC